MPERQSAATAGFMPDPGVDRREDYYSYRVASGERVLTALPHAQLARVHFARGAPDALAEDSLPEAAAADAVDALDTPNEMRVGPLQSAPPSSPSDERMRFYRVRASTGPVKLESPSRMSAPPRREAPPMRGAVHGDAPIRFYRGERTNPVPAAPAPVPAVPAPEPVQAPPIRANSVPAGQAAMRFYRAEPQSPVRVYLNDAPSPSTPPAPWSSQSEEVPPQPFPRRVQLSPPAPPPRPRPLARPIGISPPTRRPDFSLYSLEARQSHLVSGRDITVGERGTAPPLIGSALPNQQTGHIAHLEREMAAIRASADVQDEPAEAPPAYADVVRRA